MTMIPFPTTENLILWACSAIALLAVVFFRRSVRHRRHKRKQQSARRVLERIKTLPGFPQKIDYLRKIDPFVFEELLLEGFEAHGFRTIRNKRYTGDGGIDGQVIIGKYRYLIQAKRYRGHIALQHVRSSRSCLNVITVAVCFAIPGKPAQVQNLSVLPVNGWRLSAASA
ncbi:restriction endonuclease [Klebsiella pneumoniae]